MANRTWLTRASAALVFCGLLSSCAFHHRKYENPITKDTQQPDKVLFDKAMHDIVHGRYEIARLTLNTLINTYDSSEYLAKAKLAIADSWYREGGANGLAQAEAEYKDFILFYPTMPEAAESQYRICDIHYKQMEKPDRDTTQALRAQTECQVLLTQFPNSKYAPLAEQRLRDIQEVLAGSEMAVGEFYSHKGSYPAAANRLKGLVEQYPLYSEADRALWDEADAYSHMPRRFRKDEADALDELVREYPLSSLSDDAKKKLKDMEMPIPEADPVALNRMKYEEENRTKLGVFSRVFGPFISRPDVHLAAKTGTPAMARIPPLIPVSVPPPPASTGLTGQVTVTPVAPSSPPGAATAAGAPTATSKASDPQVSLRNQQLPTNHTLPKRKEKKHKHKKEKKEKKTTAPADTNNGNTAPNGSKP
jgi:outer membrane protein assembly factor BamD